MPFSRQASSTNVAAQQRDVVGAVAQRRRAQRHDVQPEVQVLAELAGRDRRLQIAVGRGDDAHVDLQRLLAADARELARLQHAQHLGLRRQRSCRRSRRGRWCRRRPARTGRACAPVAPVNAPRSCPNSSDSISSGGMAAQFTLTNGLSAQRARAVDGARDQLLAGARFAGDQHPRARRRHLGDLGVQRVHRRRCVPDHLEALVGHGAQPLRPRAPSPAARARCAAPPSAARDRAASRCSRRRPPWSRARRPPAWRAPRS